MKCPRCFGNDISPVSNTHYICNNPNCTDDNGNKTQFFQIFDDKKHFPYDQIFPNREDSEFYRLPYLQK